MDKTKRTQIKNKARKNIDRLKNLREEAIRKGWYRWFVQATQPRFTK